MSLLVKKVTMQVIADKLNISKNIVFQALSGKYGVSDETRKTIQKATDELGYSYKKETMRSLEVKKTEISPSLHLNLLLLKGAFLERFI